MKHFTLIPCTKYADVLETAMRTYFLFLKNEIGYFDISHPKGALFNSIQTFGSTQYKINLPNKHKIHPEKESTLLS